MNSLRSNVRVNDFSLWGGNCCSNYCRSARKVCSGVCNWGCIIEKTMAADGRWGDIAAEYRLWWGWYITCHLVPCRVVPVSFPHMKQNVSDLMLKKSEQKLARYFQSLWRNSFNFSEKFSKNFLVSSQLLENILQDWFSFSK